MLRTTVCVSLLAIGVSLVGCGGSSGSSTGSSVPLSDLPGKLTTELCKVFDQCYGPAYAAFAGADCQSTELNQLKDGPFAAIQASIDKKVVTYHADRVDACIQAIDAAGCSVVGAQLPDACKTVFTGTVATGGDCTNSSECQSTNDTCAIGSSCPGKCTARAAAGGACTASDDCQDGLLCSGGKCVQGVAQGAACSAQSPCQPGLFCMGNPGKCTAATDAFSAKAGDTCDLLAGPLCAAGLSCEVTVSGQTVTQKCVSPVSSGATCHVAVPDECPSGQYCKTTSMQTPGTCTPLPTAGQPCATVQNGGPQCAAGLACDNTCVQMQHDGGSCTSDVACYSGHCVSGKCQAAQCLP